jgi:hypothetical protein
LGGLCTTLEYSTSRLSKVLQTYTLEEILEFNDLTEEEVLFFLVEEDFIQLPDPKPVDFYYDDKE